MIADWSSINDTLSIFSKIGLSLTAITLTWTIWLSDPPWISDTEILTDSVPLKFWGDVKVILFRFTEQLIFAPIGSQL